MAEETTQGLLFPEEETQEILTPEEKKLLNDPEKDKKERLQYLYEQIKQRNITQEELKDFRWLPEIIFTMTIEAGFTPLQVYYYGATEKEKLDFILNSHAEGETIDYICDVLLCKKTFVYRKIKEHKEEALKRKIAFLEEKIKEYEYFNFFSDIKTRSDFSYNNNYETITLEEFAEEAKKRKREEAYKAYILEKHKNDTAFFDKQEKQYIKYKRELEKAKKDLLLLQNKPEIKQNDICKTSSTMPNDIIFNDFFDLLTYYDNLELFATRQSNKSHSLTLTPKITENKIRLKLYKDKIKDITLQMDKPINTNMAYMRDLFVLAAKHLAKLDKEQLTPENLRQNPISINISTIDYFENSNYKNLRKVQEMSKDENIQFLGSLALWGKSKVFDGKGKSKKELAATETGEKAFIPMFKKISYGYNNIELLLNDVFPWTLFTLKYFTILPDNYLKLSENTKTLLMYLVSQARIKKEVKFNISYSDLQILLNLKSYEEDKIHATERIIKPIQKTIEEINQNNSYFLCIDEEINTNRTPKEILETGYISVICKGDLKSLIDNVNQSKNNKIKKAQAHKKKA